jgi:hypothetical protein
MKEFIIQFHSILMAFLITLLLVVDCAGHFSIYSNRRSIADILTVFAERGNLLLLAGLIFSLSLLAMTIDYASVSAIGNKFQELSRAGLAIITDRRSLLFSLLGVLLFFVVRNVFRAAPLGEIAADLIRSCWHVVRNAAPGLVLLVIAFVGYHAFHLLGNALLQTETPRQVYVEWNVSTACFAVILAVVAYCRVRIAGASGIAAVESTYWLDILKDYVVYFVIITGFVGGLTRWARSDAVASRHAWGLLGLFLTIAALYALSALVLDSLHINTLNRAAEMEPLRQRAAVIKTFIHVRNFMILLPLCSVQAVYLIGRVIQGQSRVGGG